MSRIFLGNNESIACLTKELNEVLAMTDPARFIAFVDLYIKHGTHLIELYNCPGKTRFPNPCVMAHAMSQTWYINLWPGEITHMMKVETWNADIQKLESAIGKTLKVGTHRNEKEG